MQKIKFMKHHRKTKKVANKIKVKSCCTHTKTEKKCKRNSDNKIFFLPRRFSRKRCKKGVVGFSMRSSCAPYKDCK